MSAHAGHLTLSAIAGAAYGAMPPRGARPVPAGLAFGLGFFALAYGLVGPALGVTPKPWRGSPGSFLRQGMLHALFGVTTAAVADGLARRL
jgi:hypothetical protein